MTRRAALLLLIGPGLLVGCTDLPTGPAEPGIAPAVFTKGGPVMVPVSWTYDVTVTGTETVMCENDNGSPPFMAAPRDFVMEGKFTHIGPLHAETTSARFVDCLLKFEGGMPVAAALGAVVDLVAPNGDKLHLEGVLQGLLSSAAADGDWTIVGGTGRFANASGWMKTHEQGKSDGTGSVGGGWGMITPPGQARR